MTGVGRIAAGMSLSPLTEPAPGSLAGVGQVGTAPAATREAGDPPRGGASFGQLLSGALGELSALETRADLLTARLARGEPVELHEVIIATEKAQLALDLAVQLRNRVVEAYQEIMRMPV